MAHEIRVPRLGWSMEEGTFVRWLKPAGAQVRAGEPLFELESDKALQEVEAVDAGILRFDPANPASGATVAVGAVLGYLLALGEEIPASVPPPSPPEDGRQPAERKTSQSAALPQAMPPGAGAEYKASPRARRAAAELGMDWRTLPGSGRGGRVRERDVHQLAAADSRAARLVELSPRRRAIAERMAASQWQTAPVTLTTRCDATNLVHLRQQYRAAGEIVPTYTDIVAKLAAVVLREHPHLAARWNGQRLELPAVAGPHIGIAVDTEEGLLVPVLRDAGRRSLGELAAESRRLVEQARAGHLPASDMQGAHFTITNLGAFGIDAFTPIINPPEVAILGLGAIRRESVVLASGQIAPREMLTLSLTFDHRAVDGAPAARFLQALAAAIAAPASHIAPGFLTPALPSDTARSGPPA